MINPQRKNAILILSEAEAECLLCSECYGASVLASAIHYLLTGRSFSVDAVGKPREL